MDVWDKPLQVRWVCAISVAKIINPSKQLKGQLKTMVKFVVNVVKTKDTDVALHIYNNKIPMKIKWTICNWK